MSSGYRFSPFHLTTVYPFHEQVAEQQRTSQLLGQFIRELASPRPNVPASRSLEIVSELHLGTQGIVASLDSGFWRLAAEISDMAERLEWGLEVLHEDLRVIIQLLSIPERHLDHAQQMAGQWFERLQNDEFTEEEGGRLFAAASERYREAVRLMPSSDVEYAARVGQAELNLLAGDNDVAEQLLRESISFATKKGSFDPISYSCRLLGRIAFARGEVSEAVKQLSRAVKLSPGYAIAHYDFAQYLAHLGGVRNQSYAIAHLWRAIELKSGFWYMAAVELSFEPIRPRVEDLRQEILEVNRQQVRKLLSPIEAILSEILLAQQDRYYQICRQMAALVNISDTFEVNLPRQMEERPHPDSTERTDLHVATDRWISFVQRLQQVASQSQDLAQLQKLAQILPVVAKPADQLFTNVRAFRQQADVRARGWIVKHYKSMRRTAVRLKELLEELEQFTRRH